MDVWGEEIFPEGVGVKRKNGTGGERGEGKILLPHPPTSPLHQSSSGQASKMVASKT